MTARAAIALALLLGAARLDAQQAAAPSRLVLEAGVGPGAHDAGCNCPQIATAASAALNGHLALGLILRPTLSLYLSEDVGGNFGFDTPEESYQYHTAFAELAPRRFTALVVRAGAGVGRASALSGGLEGSGALLRVGAGIRTPTRFPVAVILAGDEIFGVAGHYSPRASYLDGIRPPFRPRTFQLSLGIRAQIALR